MPILLLLCSSELLITLLAGSPIGEDANLSCVLCWVHYCVFMVCILEWNSLWLSGPHTVSTSRQETAAGDLMNPPSGRIHIPHLAFYRHALGSIGCLPSSLKKQYFVSHVAVNFSAYCTFPSQEEKSLGVRTELERVFVRLVWVPPETDP